MQLTGKSGQEIYNEVKVRYGVMQNAGLKALQKKLQTKGSLIEGNAYRHFEYAVEKGGICGRFINVTMARALSGSEANASMSRICAAPTAGSCGILPSVVISLTEELDKSEKDALDALITASGLGSVVIRNASVSGAEGGCQLECGVAAAMAAAAAVQLSGGSPRCALDGFSIAIVNIMGLICDPVAGLVQIPCAQRNASGAVNALLSADLALGGMELPIPHDEVLDAMLKVGKMLPMQLKETALGGLAVTPTGRKIKKELFGSH
jgi:L-serine dehydratase